MPEVNSGPLKCIILEFTCCEVTYKGDMAGVNIIPIKTVSLNHEPQPQTPYIVKIYSKFKHDPLILLKYVNDPKMEIVP
jgi:hypothetical protein